MSEHRGRGLRLNGRVLFVHKKISAEIPGPDVPILLGWDWPFASKDQHLTWLLRRFEDIVGAEGLMGDLCAWQTWDVEAQEILTIHAWPTNIQVGKPPSGTRACFILTLRSVTQEDMK